MENLKSTNDFIFIILKIIFLYAQQEMPHK